MDIKEIQSAMEAMLFAAGDPLPAARIAEILAVELEQVYDCAKTLSDYYSFERRGLRLVRVGQALQLCSAPEYAGFVARALEQRRPPKLSQAALEVLAIIAYYQPVTKAYIEQVRGVDSSYTVGLLTERGLIELCGKLEVPGRPSLYRTTELFLRTMGVSSLDELPELPNLTTDEGVTQLQEKVEALARENPVQLEITQFNEFAAE